MHRPLALWLSLAPAACQPAATIAPPPVATPQVAAPTIALRLAAPPAAAPPPATTHEPGPAAPRRSVKLRFSFASAALSKEALDEVTEIAAIMRQYREITRVEVQGHADLREARLGKRDVSRERAEAVRAALVQAGVEPERLLVRAWQANQPIDDNAKPEGRANNRRVALFVLEPEP